MRVRARADIDIPHYTISISHSFIIYIALINHLIIHRFIVN